MNQEAKKRKARILENRSGRMFVKVGEVLTVTGFADHKNHFGQPCGIFERFGATCGFKYELIPDVKIMIVVREE